MKKIAIVSRFAFLPVPAVLGGACEALMEILLNKNEELKNLDITYIQPEFSKEIRKSMGREKFKEVKFIDCKLNKFKEFFIKVLNRGFRILGIKKRITKPYETNVLNYCKKQKFDKIVFEGGEPNNIAKYLKYYKREQLYLHWHCQVEDKTTVSTNIGNFISVSEFISKDWEEWYKENNIDNVKCIVLKNVVDEDRFNKELSESERQNLRSELGFSKDDFVVVFNGRLIEVKGIKELIQAVIKLPENIKLMIIGSPNFKDATDSPFLTEIKQMAEQYKDKIVFTGFIDNKQVYKYYKLADMQAIPSIWNDAAPLVVFEGVLCGLPQLVTKSGGIPEYVCKEGSIVIPRDHDLVENLVKNIEKLSKDKKLLKAMSDINKEFSKRYCKTNYYKDFVKIMEEK